MRKMIETAALGLSLCLAGLGSVTYAHAQDPEEGAVDLNETSNPAPEPRSAPAWESPSGNGGFDSDLHGEESDQPKAKEPGPGKLRLYAGTRLGVGGGFRPKGFDTGIYSASIAPGGQLGAEYRLLKYFGLGLETRLWWVQQKSSEHSYLNWDLVLKPRGVYRLKARAMELYFAVPAGMSMSIPGSQKVLKGDGTMTKEEGKLGATVGLAGGASFFFGDHWSLNAEMGWNWTFMRWGTWVPAQTAAGVPSMQVETVAKVLLGQLTLVSVNAQYAF